MLMPARVLLIGKLQVNLDARAAILSHFWKVTTLAHRGDEISRVNADVVVICETLSEPERQRCVDQIREDAPTILVVKVNGYDSGPYAGADATVDEEHGPGALVSTVYELLTERGIPSRAWPSHEGDARVQ